MALLSACGGGSAADAGADGSPTGLDVQRIDVVGMDVGIDTAPPDASPSCHADTECSDGVYCNGPERCAPGAPGADARGCVAGMPPCAAGQTCDEAHAMCTSTGGCADADGDGHRAASCGGDDCDDTDPHRFPGNTEVCAVTMMAGADGGTTLVRVDPTHDEDCDPTTFANSATHDGDHDGDGYVDMACENVDSAGGHHGGDDCADLAPASPIAPFSGSALPQNVHPTVPEVCNGVDDDCNGRIDDGLTPRTYYRDCDGDNFGDSADPGMMGCGALEFDTCMGHQRVPNNGDCNDMRADVNPSRMEVCDTPDGGVAVDENCNGSVNEMCPCTIGQTIPCGSTLPGCTMGTQTCAMMGSTSGYATCSTATTPITCYADGDGDGYAAAGAGTSMACVCPAGTTSRQPAGPASTDCNDGNPSMSPGNTEVCDGLDNDCDGTVDDGLPSATYYRDCDGDGYGDGADPGTVRCSPTLVPVCMGHFAEPNHGDCDDANAAANPAAPEVCNGIDDNCDGVRDGAAAAAACTRGPQATTMACTGGVCTVATCAAGFGDCDHNAADGCEVRLTTDPLNCGACGTACPTPGGCTAYCSASTCSCAGCAAGQYFCGGTCVAPDTTHCGASCTTCLTITHGTVTCAGGTTCSYACNAGYTFDGTDCYLVGAPRQIAPLSTSTVTRFQPTLVWVTGTNSDSTRLEICHDRACTSVLWTFDVSSSPGLTIRYPLTVSLPPGQTYFWRVTGTRHGALSPLRSPVWQFNTGILNSTVDTSWGTTPDVNGDGYGDLLISGLVPSGTSHQVRVHVHNGSATGPSTTASSTFSLPASASTTQILASAGDVNGDGFADVAVAAATGIYVYPGSASGLVTGSPTFISTGATAPPSALAGLGDVNGDGYGDVAVGIVGTTRVLVFAGSATGLGASPVTTITASDPGTVWAFGTSVAGAGDINGDGYADLVVGGGAPMTSFSMFASSRGAFVYTGGAAGLNTTPTALRDTASSRSSSDDIFGRIVAGVGDVTGDGYADLVVGSANNTYVFNGSPAGVTRDYQAELLIGSTDESATSLDRNRDGYSDVVLGLSGGDELWVFGGRAGGIGTSRAEYIHFASTTEQFGASVAGAGDVDGDGYSDLIVGAPGPTTSGGTPVGHAYLYHGSASGLGTGAVTTFTNPDAMGTNYGGAVARATASDAAQELVCRAPRVPLRVLAQLADRANEQGVRAHAHARALRRRHLDV